MINFNAKIDDRNNRYEWPNKNHMKKLSLEGFKEIQQISLLSQTFNFNITIFNSSNKFYHISNKNKNRIQLDQKCDIFTNDFLSDFNDT